MLTSFANYGVTNFLESVNVKHGKSGVGDVDYFLNFLVLNQGFLIRFFFLFFNLQFVAFLLCHLNFLLFFWLFTFLLFFFLHRLTLLFLLLFLWQIYDFLLLLYFDLSDGLGGMSVDKNDVLAILRALKVVSVHASNSAFQYLKGT